MQLHELQPTHKKRTAKRIGRGGKRGKTSGRGHKGQLARAGNSTRPEVRDMIKKLPKLRGHGVNRARAVNAERPLPVVVNIAAIATVFEGGETVSPRTLVAKGVLAQSGKRLPKVKLLGHGEIDIKVKVEGCITSTSAKEKIEAAGGTVA